MELYGMLPKASRFLTETFTLFYRNIYSKDICFFFFFCTAYGILVPQPGIEPGPSAVKAWSLNHWTTREFPHLLF